ncbi:hypothetical protein IFR05_001482 [Cadophora sp. M221]|nr:hypothetical protein IFR05_001482 [Cadophora sp. M221]
MNTCLVHVVNSIHLRRGFEVNQNFQGWQEGFLDLQSQSGLQDMVTFLVGPDQAKYIMHKKVVCHYSPVLEAAFKSGFIEGTTQTCKLEDINEETFALFMQWIYTQKIELHVDSDGKLNAGILPPLWVLAEKLIMPRLQNATINLIDSVNLRSALIDTDSLAYIYENTTTGSPLRKMFVQAICGRMAPDHFYTSSNHFPVAALIDVAHELRSFARENFGSLIQLRALNIENFYMEVEGKADSIEASMSTSSISESKAHIPSEALKNHPKGPLTFNDIGNLVTFTIGPERTKVQIHKKLVCYYSPTLDAAFNGAFSKELPRHAPSNPSMMNSPDKLNLADLAALWVLADMLLIPRLQNLAMGLIDELGRTEFNIPAILYAYQNAAVYSPLPNIFVSHAAWSSPNELFDIYGSQLPKEFVPDAAAACRNIMSKISVDCTMLPRAPAISNNLVNRSETRYTRCKALVAGMYLFKSKELL